MLASMENSPMKTEIVWVEEECHQIMPLKQEDCKLEETPAALDYILSSEEGVGENIHTSEEMQFATVKCEKDLDDEVHEIAVMDMKEDIIIEDENPLTSSSEEAGSVPPSAPDTRSEEVVPKTFYTRIGETYYCVPCDTSFHRQSDFSSHVTKSHKQINHFQCPKCDKTFQFRSKLSEHLVIHSKDDKLFCCKVCDRQFTCYSDMRKHTCIHNKGTTDLEHTRARNYRKDSPSMISANFPSVQQKREITKGKIKHLCYYCNASFNSKGEVTWHLSIVHGRRSKYSYKCPKCLKSFLRSSKLLEHMKFYPCNWKNDCNICKRTFSHRTKLFKHMQEHASGDNLIAAKVIGNSLKGDYPCKFSGKAFPLPSQLKEHEITHPKQSVFTCDLCNKSFDRKSSLANHQKKHCGAFSYSCPVCKIKFSCNTEVTRHMQSHSRYQPYSCAMCKMTFSFLTHLEKHVPVHYENHLSNSCIVCKKKFAQVSSLRYHMRLSLHGMLFACSLCGKPFLNSFALKSHLLLIHRMTRAESEFVGDSPDGLYKEVTATSNGFQDKSLDTGEVESNIGRGPSDIHQTPSLATAQIRVIDTRVIQKRIETSSGLDDDIIEVSGPNSRNEGEKSFSGEGQNIAERGKEQFTSSQYNRALIHLASENQPAGMNTNAKNCEGGNLFLTEKIIVNGEKRKNSTHLQCDMISNTTQERPKFPCKECGVHFGDVHSYKRHSILNHNDQTFACNVCGTVFLEQSKLDSHMIVHTADRPYSCFICKKAFRQIRTLRLHLQSHEGKAKFPCEVCDEIFDSIVALRQHLISHTGKEVQP